MAETNRYANGKIYRLVNSVDNEEYVGSSCTTLAKRLYSHKNEARHKPRPVHKHLNDIGWDTVDIILVELYPCGNKMELERRERYWIETLKPSLNRVIPTRNAKEWYAENADKVRERQTTYRAENADKVREANALYRSNNKDEARKEYAENAEKVCKRQAEYYAKNADKERERRLEYYAKNADKERTARAKYYEENRDAINTRRRELRVLKQNGPQSS